MYNEDTREDVRYNSFGRAFYNLGYRRRGTFRDLDVLAVHPAGTCQHRVLWFYSCQRALHCDFVGKEDPTMIGMLGTECLRRTKVALLLFLFHHPCMTHCVPFIVLDRTHSTQS
jgi:hypothetical protein